MKSRYLSPGQYEKVKEKIQEIWNDESLTRDMIEILGWGLLHDTYIDDKVKTER
jgi:hypothetical protein